MKTKSLLFRGENWGVFAGPNGYYVAHMDDDGVSHHQPANGGDGWSDSIREACNRWAAELNDADLVIDFE